MTCPNGNKGASELLQVTATGQSTVAFSERVHFGTVPHVSHRGGELFELPLNCYISTETAVGPGLALVYRGRTLGVRSAAFGGCWGRFRIKISHQLSFLSAPQISAVFSSHCT